MDVAEAQKLAYEQASKVNFRSGLSPLETFLSIEFFIPRSQFVDQETVAKQNLELDPQSCLGRVAVIAAIMEQYHSKTSLLLGEVWNDYFKELMIRKLRIAPSLADDPSFMQELLMYEEPHAVIVADGVQQLEPLSLEFGELIKHPTVETFPLWEALAASATVSEAWLENDPSKRLVLLNQAEEVCPGLTLVIENMVESYELLGRLDEAIASVRWALKRRPCARTLYVMHLLTKDPQFYERLVENYTDKIVQYF